MTRLTATLIAVAATLLTQQSANAQGGNCNCNNSAQYVGYQSADWSGHHGCHHGSGRRGCLPGTCGKLAHPDAGWAPPVHFPVNHDWAWYGAYHPQAWYGNPGGGFVQAYPSVYQPNDTTQLGYSYNKVPTWQSRPGMIPPVPRPGDYHSRSVHGWNAGSGHQCHSCQPAGVYMSPDGKKLVMPANGQNSGARNWFASLTSVFN